MDMDEKQPESPESLEGRLREVEAELERLHAVVDVLILLRRGR